MKLIPFTFTNDYDNRSTVHVNPVFVVTLRPSMDDDSQTAITFDTGTITVDGTIEVVSRQLCGDDQAEEAPTICQWSKWPERGERGKFAPGTQNAARSRPCSPVRRTKPRSRSRKPC